MIDHVSLGVSDLQRSAAFYEAVLGAIGFVCLVRREATVGFGKKYPELWLNHRPDMPRISEGSGAHVCLRARSDEMVRAFHAAALIHGGHDDGMPGPRVAAMTGYYAAFVRDSDGNRLEVACFPMS